MCLDEFNARLESKGLVPSQPWQAAIGRSNDTTLAAEYQTLERYERDYPRGDR